MGEIISSSKKDQRISYCLVQLSASEPKDVRAACKDIVEIEGVSAASAITGLFDIIAKIEADSQGTAKAVNDIRSRPSVDFAAPFEVNQIYLSRGGLVVQKDLLAKK